MTSPECDAVVIGGGFFGCSLARHLRSTFDWSVTVLERERDILQRASTINQARVHGGYHYPRSFPTAVRSRANRPRFEHEFRDCIYDAFEMHYAVAQAASKVTAAQFRIFCDRIGAPVRPASARVRKLFNPNLVEDVFWVEEHAFDAVKLKHRMRGELERQGVKLMLGAEALRVKPVAAAAVEVEYRTDQGEAAVSARKVYNCSYSRLNKLLRASGLAPIPLKHELTELALVEVPEELRALGVTVVCGPFFSIMPYPSRGLHSLSHVRDTPHHEWHDDGEGEYRDPYEHLEGAPKKSRFRHMIADAQRYLPLLAQSRHRESIWEVKTVLPRSESDDSRPILFTRCPGPMDLTCVIGAKIDNVYDMTDPPAWIAEAAAHGAR